MNREFAIQVERFLNRLPAKYTRHRDAYAQQTYDVQTRLDIALIDAVRFYDVETARKALSFNADPNFIDPGYQIAAIHFAAANQDRPLMDLLLLNGGDLNLWSPRYITPLGIVSKHMRDWTTERHAGMRAGDFHRHVEAFAACQRAWQRARDSRFTCDRLAA